MIFPVLEVEPVVQIGDKTRLSGAKSFCSSNTEIVSTVKITPEDGADPVIVTGTTPKDWCLDWVFAGATRDVQVSLEVTVGSATQLVHKTIKLVTAAEDKLFSTDDDLAALEPILRGYVPDGRSSFVNVHREAKMKILERLADRGLVAKDGSPLTADAILDKTEVRTWSRDLTLALVYNGMSNATDDVFAAKAKFYFDQAEQRAERAILKLDFDGDGTVDDGETVRAGQVTSVRICRG